MSLMAFVAIVGPIARTLGLAPWHVGIAVTLGGAAWTMCARAWGRASDRLGRRRVMLIGLLGFSLSYALLCLFIGAAARLSLPVLAAFLGLALLRTLAGAFYAAVPASSVALIATHFAPEERASRIASLGAANGLGMALGPAAAGLLAQFGLELPLIFISLLPIAALALVWRSLPRDRPQTSEEPKLQLRDPRLRWPLAIACLAMLSTGIAQISVGFYALDRLGLTASEAMRVSGFALAAAGLALLSTHILVRALAWPERRLIEIGALIAALGFGSASLATHEFLLLASYFVGAIGVGFLFAAVYALAANAVQPHEQGQAAGAISSAQGLGSIVGPIAGTLIYEFDIRAPYILIAVLLVAFAIAFRATPGRAP